tara:strand:- start:61072 stop:62034 length:963 start_codon:yes stop_codon:yes gene_type:complete
MRNLFIIASLLLTTTIVGQTTTYKNALHTFKAHYNNGDAKSAYEMMASPMQKKLTLKDTELIFETFKKNLGSIVSFKFLKAEDGVETYLTTFSNGRQNINISLNPDGEVDGLRFLPAEENREAKIERNLTKMQLPFKGEWFTVWGGDSKAQNYHVISPTQKHAFDILKLGKNRKTYERSGTRNEDYFAFSQPLLAVCDAVVHTVIEGIPDNKPGTMNPAQPTGNTVILKTENDEYIVYAHFEMGTIKVKEGESVVKGQYLGNCGNSGNSSEAHLHLHIQDSPNLMTAIGVKCYFEEVMVNGKLEVDYSPVRLDKISRPDE